MSGDEEEVEELLAKGADINTATVDGLTALHQSVIDSKPDMVRFLCEKGADVNAQDNEGWTPLHAAACCGNLAIVKYLCENGARLNVINSDKELALDLADDESCREYLEHDYRSQGVIPEQCRDQELAVMMKDAQHWLRDGEYRDQPHRRTGATAMHVAAAKGYTQLLEMLIKAGGNIRARDKDGWTPLHAAAHWAERDSCKILLEHGASIMDINYAGQNVLAVADKDVVEYLEDLHRSVDKRKSPPSAVPANILQEKNNRLSHEDHVLSTEHKQELKHKDQINENVILQSSVKLKKFDEKSPSSQSSESSSQDPVGNEGRSFSPPSAADDGRMSSAERSASEPPSLPKTAEEVAPCDRHPSTIRSTVSADRSISSFGNPVGLQRSTNMTVSASDPTKLSDGSTSTDINVSATVPIPSRPFQQPSSWINRGVQLIARSGSSSTSSTTRSSNTLSSDSSSQISLGMPSSGNNGPFTGTSSPIPSKPPPWQSNTVTESEAERRNTARIQRQHRRSTQGVTKEHLEEASRIAVAESTRRRAAAATQNASMSVSSASATKETPVARLASEERDSSSACSDRGSVSTEKSSGDVSVVGGRTSAASHDSFAMGDHSVSGQTSPVSPAVVNPTQSPTLTPNQTATIRRKGQGLSVSRSNRRSTGPVLPEDIHAAVSVRQNNDGITSANTASHATSSEPALTNVRSSANPPTSVSTRTTVSNVVGGRTDIGRNLNIVETSSALNVGAHSTTSVSSRNVAQPRLPGQTTGSTFTTSTYTISTRPTEMNLNYKALYEKEKMECERIRKELEEYKRTHEHNGSVAALRTTSSRFRNGSPAYAPTPIVKSSSGNSLDDGERRALERKIADLEIQLKGLSQLRMENQRLKEENGALVRVISKMTI
ncbi:Ankyrin repeat [Parelaphostrongylus tenuis]|uniref:Ankyrin repeat n=1 Tax=Parelaphostrongylus tenuis TaxID=148309 RepID=A0AAD5WKL1_PARTN|nr:Ankyrin repeat [Parelaphostrongylus tenuis]